MISFTAGGTTWTPGRNPARPLVTPRPEQATARSAGGVSYGYTPVVTDELVTLEWSGMSGSDVAGLQSFFVTVNGMVTDFTIHDPWANISYDVALAEPKISITETSYDRYRVACVVRRSASTNILGNAWDVGLWDSLLWG